MSATVKLLTVDDLKTFPDDGNRYEIVEGALFVSPAPSRAHQTILQELLLLIQGVLSASRLGQAFFAPVDVRFTDFDQVQPDLVVLLNATLYAFRGNTVFAPPDMVVEAISPSSRLHDAERKFALYAEHGVRECWLADPERRTSRAYVLRQGAYEEIAPVDGRLTSIVIPGLSVDIARLFASLDEDL